MEGRNLDRSLPLSKGGKRPCIAEDKFAEGKFSTHINPKDGHAIADCEDPRERRMLEFIIPIVYPKNPIRITMTLANTIFGALPGARPVSWEIII